MDWNQLEKKGDWSFKNDHVHISEIPTCTRLISLTANYSLCNQLWIYSIRRLKGLSLFHTKHFTVQAGAAHSLFRLTGKHLLQMNTTKGGALTGVTVSCQAGSLESRFYSMGVHVQGDTTRSTMANHIHNRDGERLLKQECLIFPETGLCGCTLLSPATVNHLIQQNQGLDWSPWLY